MSHTTTVKSVPIKSRKALDRAIAALNTMGVACSLIENATPRLYYQDQLRRHKNRADNKADLVIKLNDTAYDIGLLRTADGSYELVYDPYVPYGKKGVTDVLGVPFSAPRVQTEESKAEEAASGIGKLLQEYSKAEVMGVAEAQGHYVSSCDWNETSKSWDILVQA